MWADERGRVSRCDPGVTPLVKNGRDAGIRTRDPLTPSQVR